MEDTMSDVITTDYIHNLRMGDVFRFPNGGGGHMSRPHGPVLDTQSYGGEWIDVRFAGAETLHRHAWTKVEILHRAPLCGCGVDVESCWNECEWPDELEELWQSVYGS